MHYIDVKEHQIQIDDNQIQPVFLQKRLQLTKILTKIQ